MPLSAPAATSDASFRNGTLFLAKGVVEMRITGSPVPRSVMRRGRGTEWEAFSPEFRLVHPYRPSKKKAKEPAAAGRRAGGLDQLCFDFLDETSSTPPREKLTPAQRRKRAFEQFRFSLEKPVARILEPFRTHQWALLVMLQHDPGSRDLAEANPALVFALAQKLKGDRELIAALRCSEMRQRDLLEVLGLPSSPAAVNLFRKVDPHSLSGDNWPALVEVIREELALAKPRLNHLSSINAGVVEILLDPRASGAASPQLLEEVARDRAENHRGRIVHLITSTLRMQDELRVEDRCLRFQNLARLVAVHDQVTENYRRRVRQLIDASGDGATPGSFMSPPIPGIAGHIEPITSPSALVDEGEAQGNCVASYATRVREGNTYIYRVLQPQRATLSVVRRSALAPWEVGELEGRYNTEVEDSTEDFVSAWLDRYQEVV